MRLAASVRQRAVSALPSRTGAQVDAHVRWYAAHLARLRQKKAILEQWRLDKQRQQQQEEENENDDKRQFGASKLSYVCRQKVLSS